MLRHILMFLHNTDRIPYFREFQNELACSELSVLSCNSDAFDSGCAPASGCEFDSCGSPMTNCAPDAFTAEDCLLLTDSDAVLSALSTRFVSIGLMNPTVPAQSLFSAYALLESLESADLAYLKRIHAHGRHYPALIAETGRLLIREFTLSDHDALFRLKSIPENNRFLPERPSSYNVEMDKLRSYIANIYPFSDFALWGVFDRESGALLGQAGFSLSPALETPEFGYVIDVPYRKKGYATETVKALLAYAKSLGLNETLIRIHPDNIASLKVLASCEFPYRQISSDEDFLLFRIDLQHDLPTKQ